MKPILILYATKEGQTLRVAGHIASTLGGRGHAVHCISLTDLKWQLDWSYYSGCILAASIHMGKHEASMCDFVRQHLFELSRLPTAFVSLSLTEAVAEDTARSAEERGAAAERVRGTLETFFEETGWRPSCSKAVAGALQYSHYGWAIRLVMKAIAKKQGLSTDTEHDHQYTDWEELERFSIGFAARLG
jgi:menaquinone-dependent protoporphyrinogen oxidase